MTREELEARFESAKDALAQSLKNNQFSFRERNKRDLEQGRLFQELVKIGAREQIKKKYRQGL